MELTEKEKQELLDLALSAIKTGLEGKAPPGMKETTPILREKRGAFVTLKKRGQLRGCIGYIQPVKPLYETIERMALAAAFEDPRFPALRKEELKDLSVEISVLTPLREIQDVGEIRVGVHGLFIVRGPRSGLLLPQVAVEYGWDTETFLKETCHKAGLSAEAWRDEATRIYVFSAEIFGDLA
ncbi:MAG: AmmeMemoRadiSam system protein A [Syntrophaceae bacterium]|nr:AmmeMemoRadiSam system protein A [Syntrophaceae bacterium]